MSANSSKQLLLLGILLISASSAGCFQTSVAGQTLPSAYYLDDDVQYFSTGPEQKLARQIRTLERYKAERAANQQNIDINPDN